MYVFCYFCLRNNEKPVRNAKRQVMLNATVDYYNFAGGDTGVLTTDWSEEYLDNHEFGSESDTIKLIVGEGIDETGEKSITFILRRAQLAADPDPVLTGFGPITQQLSFKAFSDDATMNNELQVIGDGLT